MSCRWRWVVAAIVALPTSPSAQTVAGRTPNTRPAWTLGAGAVALRIGHRFEFLAGGDELLNIPTLSLGVGMGRRLTAGLDFTSNSEIVPDRLGGNETQFFVGFNALRAPRAAADLTGAYNTLARSFDAALTGVLSLGTVSLLGEARGFQDAAGSGEAGASLTAGGVVSLTPRLELVGDLGGHLVPEGGQTVWSAGVNVIIPGSPHTFSLHATNGGATTLQGAAHRQVLGLGSVRIGFVFTIPLGSARQWASIFRRNLDAVPAAPAGADAIIDVRQIALHPIELRIAAGQAVAWLNHDPLVHTITADDRSWESGNLRPGASFLRRFDRPGRYPYHCEPHPQMRGVIIVE
ncbi:MAG: cupredoxin domain-containing protein [Gemmatimonadota bacterium]|nr:cupredoxin domain-containing protein [Gemmatimonadota bacterium]